AFSLASSLPGFPAVASSPRRAAFIAATVLAFGIRGSNGSALSVAIRTIIMRKASDTVRPIAPSTAAASSLIRSLIRARTMEFSDIIHSPVELQCSTVKAHNQDRRIASPRASVARTCFVGPRLLASNPRVPFGGQNHAVEVQPAPAMLFGGDTRLYARRCVEAIGKRQQIPGGQEKPRTYKTGPRYACFSGT